VNVKTREVFRRSWMSLLRMTAIGFLAALAGFALGLFAPAAPVNLALGTVQVILAFVLGMAYERHVHADETPTPLSRRMWHMVTDTRLLFAVGGGAFFIVTLALAAFFKPLLRPATSDQAAGGFEATAVPVSPMPTQVGFAAFPSAAPTPMRPRSTPTAAPSPTPTPAPPRYVVTSQAGKVNFRREPALTDNVLAQLPNGTLVEGTGNISKDDRWTWIEVYVPDLDQTGWIVADLLDKQP